MFKKELIFGILGAVLAVGLTTFYGFQYQNRPQIPGRPFITQDPTQALRQSPISLTLEEIKKHNLAKDCWVIISNNVYEVTSYIGQHPGGASRLSPLCGQDMTGDFLNQRHSALVGQLHAQMLLGPLNGQTSILEIQNLQNNVAKLENSALTRNDGRGGEFEDD